MTVPFSAYAAEIYLRGLGDEVPGSPPTPRSSRPRRAPS